jgi:transposase
MANKGRKTPRPRRAFTSEFKAEIVEQCQRGDRSIGQVARGLRPDGDRGTGVGVRQAERNAGERSDGLTSQEREELAPVGPGQSGSSYLSR